MVTLQMVSFVLLWIVIIAEGILLWSLYRHVGLLYVARTHGLVVGTQAPPVLARDARGDVQALPDLLSADYNLLIFGALSCSGCRALLKDQEVRSFLAARAVPGYFLVKHRDAADGVDHPSMDFLAVDEKTFTDYQIAVTPFAYVIDRTGTITVGGPVGGGLPSLIELCEQAYRRGRRPAQVPIQVAPIQHTGR